MTLEGNEIYSGFEVEPPITEEHTTMLAAYEIGTELSVEDGRSVFRKSIDDEYYRFENYDAVSVYAKLIAQTLRTFGANVDFVPDKKIIKEGEDLVARGQSENTILGYMK